MILGSGELIQALVRRNLIDEFRLNIHPLVLGAGRRLFSESGPAAPLKLVESTTTTSGVLMAVYRLV